MDPRDLKMEVKVRGLGVAMVQRCWVVMTEKTREWEYCVRGMTLWWFEIGFSATMLFLSGARQRL